jgi:nitrile hydratase accessory protein
LNNNLSSLKPLASQDGCPAFDEAWQAEVLAMADSLVAKNIFTADDWSSTLGEQLRIAGDNGEPDNQDTYYKCALVSLEKLITRSSEISLDEIDSKQGDWENAYHRTPHGHPVLLTDDS